MNLQIQDKKIDYKKEYNKGKLSKKKRQARSDKDLKWLLISWNDPLKGQNLS